MTIRVVFDAGVLRVLTQIRMGGRRGSESSIERKIRSLRGKRYPDRTAGG